MIKMRIAKNYQHEGHFLALYELYEMDELISAVNHVVEDMNHRFTLDVLTRTVSPALPGSSFFQIPMLLKNHLLLLSIKPLFLQKPPLKSKLVCPNERRKIRNQHIRRLKAS